MKKYLFCPVCGLKYNVSLLRDSDIEFVCADCENRRRAKILGRKFYPIYNKGGFATVKGVNAR
jgi:hypothetical protein